MGGSSFFPGAKIEALGYADGMFGYHFCGMVAVEAFNLYDI